MGNKYEFVETDNEMVNRPSHYTAGKIEVIDMIDSAEWLAHFCAGNTLKYLLRHEHKGKKVEDLEKAEWYLKRLIQHYKETEEDKAPTEEKDFPPVPLPAYPTPIFTPAPNYLTPYPMTPPYEITCGIMPMRNDDGSITIYQTSTGEALPPDVQKRITTGLKGGTVDGESV